MKKINIFKKIYYSIANKKYDQMIVESPFKAIGYLAILELLFVLILCGTVAHDIANGSIGGSFDGIYYFVSEYLVVFLYDSIALTLDTMLVLTIAYYILRRIIKKRVKYSHIFNLATYASTLPLLIKYVSYSIFYFVQAFDLRIIKIVYTVLMLLYFFINSKHLPIYEKKEERDK